MPYHLLYETQAAKDRLLTHRVPSTCMAPIPFPNQQHRTLSPSITDTAPTAPSLLKQLHAPQDALPTATLPPHSPAPQQTLKDTLPTLRSLPLGPLQERIPTLSSPQPPRPSRALSPATGPLFLISLIIIVFILLVILELRVLEAHASLFDRFDNWLRRFHKGTSKFRAKNQRPARTDNEEACLPASALRHGAAGKRKAKQNNTGFGSPGFAIKSLFVSAGQNCKRAVRRVMAGSEGGDIVVRSFDGIPVAPLAPRPWELPYEPLPHMTAAPGSGTQASWIVGAAVPRISYGVPPTSKPARGRRTTIASKPLEPEAAVEGGVTSVLRQQAMADDEASAAVDVLMMGMPRGEDGCEERDLEALEGRSVRVGFGGGEGLAVRRGWKGAGGGGGGVV